MQKVYWRWADLHAELTKLNRPYVSDELIEILYTRARSSKHTDTWSDFTCHLDFIKDQFAQDVANKLSEDRRDLSPYDVLRERYAELLIWAVSEIIRTERMSAFNALKGKSK